MDKKISNREYLLNVIFEVTHSTPMTKEDFVSTIQDPDGHHQFGLMDILFKASADLNLAFELMYLDGQTERSLNFHSWSNHAMISILPTQLLRLIFIFTKQSLVLSSFLDAKCKSIFVRTIKCRKRCNIECTYSK